MSGRMSPKMRGFLLRIPQAALSAVVCVLALQRYPYIGFAPFYVLLLLLCVGASNEMAALMYHHARPDQRERPARLITMLCGILPPLVTIVIVVARHAVPAFDFASALLFCMLVASVHMVIMVSYIISIERELQRGGKDMAHTTHTTAQLAAYYVTALYIGLPATVLVLVTVHSIGAILMLCAGILVALFDTTSYLCGITLARRTGFVAVSPRKSVIGYAGGALIAMGVMFALLRSTRVIDLPPLTLLPIILVTTAAAVVGDLFESALKRVAQKKDSGRLVAGRGGLLDSVDSHLVAVPIFCALCIWAL